MNCKLILIDNNGLITCYFFFKIGYFVISNNSIFEKGVPFLLQAKGETAQLAWKK